MSADDENNIWLAAGDGDVTRVQALLAADPTLVVKGDEQGYTAVHAAASYGHRDLLQFLLNAGGDLSVRDTDGDTPLHHVDDPDMALLLLALGADPTLTNNAGKTAPEQHLEDEEDAMVEFWRLCGALPPPSDDEEFEDIDDDDNAGDDDHGVADAGDGGHGVYNNNSDGTTR